MVFRLTVQQPALAGASAERAAHRHLLSSTKAPAGPTVSKTQTQVSYQPSTLFFFWFSSLSLSQFPFLFSVSLSLSFYFLPDSQHILVLSLSPPPACCRDSKKLGKKPPVPSTYQTSPTPQPSSPSTAPPPLISPPAHILIPWPPVTPLPILG